MKKNKHKSIRDLAYKAKKGNIKAAFQLAEYYNKGQFVAENKEKANYCTQIALGLFSTQSLQISSVKLVDFRLFKATHFHFCHGNHCGNNLTVIVGINGAGKTTLLDAIAKNLSWLIIRMTSPSQGGKGDIIEEREWC